MTLKEFLKQYAQGINYDNAYGEQCVDWFRGYCKHVLEIAQPAGVKGAYQFWDNRNSDPNIKNNFTAIENTATAIPQYGDVVIWGIKLNGEFGHVAICVDKNATTSKFVSSDQNWQGTSTQTNQAATMPALITHNYNYVVGFLRPKNQEKVLGLTSQESTTMNEQAKKFFAKIKGNINTSVDDDPQNWSQNDIDNVSNEINTTYKDKKSLQESETNLKNQISAGTVQIESLNSQLEQQKTDFGALQKSFLEEKQVLVATAKDTLDKQAKDYEKNIAALELTITQLKTNINTIEVEKDYTLKELLIKVWKQIWKRI